MDIGGSLRSLGLEQYEAAFHENAIDFSVLPNLIAPERPSSIVRPEPDSAKTKLRRRPAAAQRHPRRQRVGPIARVALLTDVAGSARPARARESTAATTNEAGQLKRRLPP